MKKLRVKDTLTITISDVNGSRSYNFAQVLKKYLLYFIIAIVVVIITGSVLINFLYSEVDELKDKKDQIQSDFVALKEQNNALNRNIETRQQELDSLNDKIKDIEKIVGIDSVESNNSIERVDLAKITLVEKKYMLMVIPNGYPIKNRGVTSAFGWRTHPVLKKRHLHAGTDFRAKIGTPVRSTANGVVKYAGYNQRGYGYMIIISHKFGFETFYTHLSKIGVKIGDVIKKGERIGLSGRSGLTSGPNLHYEVRYAQKLLEPMRFVKWNMQNYESIFKQEKKVKWQSLINQMNQETIIFRQPS